MDFFDIAPLLGVTAAALGIALRVAGTSWERKQRAALLAPLAAPQSSIQQLSARNPPSPIERPTLPAAREPRPRLESPTALAMNDIGEEAMADTETKESFERFKKLEEAFTDVTYMVLCVSRSEENTRKFFERCLKKAQTRWGEEHADEIMSALSDALTKSTAALSKEADKKRRILEALERIDRE